MTARQAASALGVSLPTLYSYVSRGMVRSEEVSGDSRIRRYWREDVNRLVERKDFRKNPANAAARGLHWGSPVLESALTLIDQGRLFYRGMDAIELARHATFEEVAALLWTGDSMEAEKLFSKEAFKGSSKLPAFFKQAAITGPIVRCQQVLSLADAADPTAYDLRPAAVARCGARILPLMFQAVSGAAISPPMDASLARAWLPRRKSAAPALRAALILCADHELNVSAFTARCIASAGATPYQVVLGALAALTGRRHGGVSEEIKALFAEAEATRQHRQLLARHLRVFGRIPGFGHPLYPDGDPRAQLLLSLARTHGRGAALELTHRLIEAARGLTEDHPNLDFGLAALARSLDLPPEAPMVLFALGRTIGWIAHAIEQYADVRLIRPRAHYVGPTA